MKKLLILGLFITGLIFALLNFQGLANQGKYSSIILDFQDTVPTTLIKEQLTAIAQDKGQEARLNSIFSVSERLYIVEGDEKALNKLRQSSLKQYVEAVEPNYVYHSLDVPNDPDYSKQWNFRSINVEKAWDETKGKGVTVAVIDSGVSRVPDLKETTFVPGYNFVSDRIEARTIMVMVLMSQEQLPKPPIIVMG